MIYVHINQWDPVRTGNSLMLMALSCFLIALAFSMIFIVGYSNVISSRYDGPLIFGLSVFLPLTVGLFVLLLFSYIFINKYPPLSLIYVFSGFLLKYVMPYYVFEGYVHHDTPIHYLSALYLKDHELNLGYHYHLWPSSLFLVNILKTISGLGFPIDYSLIALVSRFLIPLSIYLISRRLLANSRSVLVAMMALLVFEPFIIHPCPLITTTALTIVAIMVFLGWLQRRELRWSYILVILGASIATYHAVMPIALTLSILAVLAFYDLFPRLGFIKANMLSRHETSRIWLVATMLIAIVVLYNTYVAVLVTRSIVKTLELIVQGGEARLDVYSLTMESPELRWQYDVITNIRIIALLFLLGIPSVIVALKLLVKYFTSKSSIVERMFFAIVVIAGINALLFIVFSIILQTGLVERLYQISYILSPILTAYFYENTSNTSFRKSSVLSVGKIVSLVILTGIFVFMPMSMFTPPSYKALYVDAFVKPELATAQWIANHISIPEARFDGSNRLNKLAALYLYPSNVYGVNLSITRDIEVKALKKDYTYFSGAIITTRKPLSTGSTIVKGLSDTILNEYIENLPNYLDKLFSNSVCEVFIYK